jgi:hypothetical protein
MGTTDDGSRDRQPSDLKSVLQADAGEGLDGPRRIIFGHRDIHKSSARQMHMVRVPRVVADQATIGLHAVCLANTRHISHYSAFVVGRAGLLTAEGAR